MKKIITIGLFSFSLILSACGTQEENNVQESDSEIDVSEENNNLIRTVNVTHSAWINYNGQIDKSNENMVLTESIPYISGEKYIINQQAYVSYYSDDEFIDTILYKDNLPVQLQNVENANQIKLSFNKTDLDDIILTQEK